MKLPVASALDDPATRQPAMHPPSRGRPTPHQLLVLGVDSADIVAGAGGLICDSVLAGLHVKVYLEAEEADKEDRALRILGVDGCKLPDRFEFESEWPDAVFFATAFHERHRGVRRLVADAARRHCADVGVWGGMWPLNRDAGVGIEHRLSTAARAFKLHAMAAVGKRAHIPPTETFRRGLRSLKDVPPPLPHR